VISAGPIITRSGDQRATIRDVLVLRDVGALLAEWSARRTLRRLIDQFGHPGLVAAHRSPGLGAALDQHVAAVRDMLDGRPRGEGSATLTALPAVGTGGRAVRLAAYARSLVDEQRRGGGAIPAPREEQWEDAGWVALRLLAVCRLGRDLARGAG
jgi:hypothetical protein